MPRKITSPRILTFIKKAVESYPPGYGNSWTCLSKNCDIDSTIKLPLPTLKQYGWPAVQLALYRARKRSNRTKHRLYEALLKALKDIQETIPNYLSLLNVDKDKILSQLDSLITTNSRKD